MENQTTITTTGKALDLPVANAIDALRKVNPDAKIEAKFLGEGEIVGNLWGIDVLSPSANLSVMFRQPGLQVCDITTKRTGRFTRTHLIMLVAAMIPDTPVEAQHRAIMERMDVDAVMILGVKRPGTHRLDQGGQTMLGLEDSGLSLGEVQGLTNRLMNDVNAGYTSQGEPAPFPYASKTGQHGGSLFVPKTPAIISKLN